MRRFILPLLLLVIAGCATNAIRTRDVRVGMTKADVVSVLGKPMSMGADKQSEVMYYRLMEGSINNGDTRTYFVRLIDGKVDSFGRVNELQVPAESLPLPPPPP